MSKAEELINKDEKYVQTCYPSRTPLAFTEGRGAVLKGLDGKEYLDCFSGIAVNNVGHCHPKVVKAIQEQAAKLIHVSFLYYHTPMTMLAEKLAQVAPKGMSKCFFASGGAEAVEGAVKLAKKYAVTHGKSGMQVISLECSFHGRTALALTLTGQSKYKVKQGNFANVPGVVHAPAPYCYRCPLDYPDCGLWCASFLEDIIDLDTTREVAAVLIESVLGEGGLIVPPKEYLPEVRKICTSQGISLILDEVQSGSGRTGRMFAFEHFGVVPDIIVMGKGVGGGMPLSVVIAKDEVASAWDPGDHAHTFSGNPVCCAAGVAALEVLVEEKLPENATKVGNHILQSLNTMKQKYPVIGDVRGLGLMIGVELVKDQAKKTPAQDEATKVKASMQNQGVLIGVGGWHKNVLRIQPPLVLTTKQADRLVDALDKSFKEL